MKALLSVSDKTGITAFAKGLSNLGFEIVSTGGTYKKIREDGIDAIEVSDVTGFPEMLDGRVKTLHPIVHAGILAMRDNEEHVETLKEHNIDRIDVVCINLYPFKETVLKEGVTLEEAIENIDIGGPTMLRSAAKNHKDVLVVCSPDDYEKVLSLLKEYKEVKNIPYDEKYKLALKVFEMTASYDAMICEYLRDKKNYDLPDNPTFTFEKMNDLRYGENPHQKAHYYKNVFARRGRLVHAKQLNGKELSFNNINDASGAIDCLREMDGVACVAVKHANPCGVATCETILGAYQKAFDSDPVSIFGGIVAVNAKVNLETAKKMNEIFLEIVIAPEYDEDALAVLKEKKNLRVLEIKDIAKPDNFGGNMDIKKIDGGLLIQGRDDLLFENYEVMTKTEPTPEQIKDLIFGMKVVKHVKSNAIVLSKNGATVGIGPGQTNRIGSLEIAIKNAGERAEGSVLSSDAFFPFDDCVTLAGKHKISAIIQPGGSIKDEDSIKKCDELKIPMIFTHVRHFKH